MARSAAVSPSSDLQRILAFPRGVWVMVIGSFINRLGTFVLPYMALYLNQKGYGIRESGYVLASWGVGNLLAAVIGGHLADTLGRRLTVVISMFSCAFFLVLLSLMEPLWGIMCFAFLTALFSEIYRPAGHALVADLVEKEDRVLVYAILRWAINAGFAIGPAIAGVLSNISFQWIFWFDAFTSAAYGVLALWFLPRIENYDKPPPGHVFKAFSSLKRSVQVTFSDVMFVQVFFASFFIAFGFLQTFVTFGLDVKSRGYSELMFGLILGLNGTMIILMEIPLSLWVRRRSQRGMMILGYALIAMGFSVFAIKDGLWPYFVGMSVLTLGEMVALPVAMAYVSNLAPDDMRGRYMGMWGFSWALAMVAATTVGVRLFDWLGSSFWVLVSVLCALAAVMMMYRPIRPSLESIDASMR